MPEHQPIDTAAWSDEAYQHYILQGVSRTFALTIPQLPDALIEVVGNGYLLCRIADTIEDAAELSAAQKRCFAALFIRVVRGAAPASDFAQQLLPLLSEATPAAERDLIRNSERVLRVTGKLSARQQLALTRCVTIMLEGMAYFQQTDCHEGLRDFASFNSYCYHVAGVVGEMLTELYCDYSPAIDQHRDTLMTLAVSFGQGLQMTNILKDIWDDKRRGACWLPRSLMRQHGIEPGGLIQAQGSAAFGAMLDQLIGHAHAHLCDALRYTLLLPRSQTGLRRFCLWSVGMAMLTLRRLHQQPGFSHSAQVKISRSQLKLTMALCNTFVRWDYALQGLFRLAGSGLPPPKPTAGTDNALRVAYDLPTASPTQRPTTPLDRANDDDCRRAAGR